MKKIVSFLVVAVLIFSLAACSGSYTDGTYTGTAPGHNDDLMVEVVVEGGKITQVAVVQHAETDGIFELAEEAVITKIIEKNGTKGVDSVAGATVSSEAILQAVDNALAS